MEQNNQFFTFFGNSQTSASVSSSDNRDDRFVVNEVFRDLENKYVPQKTSFKRIVHGKKQD